MPSLASQETGSQYLDDLPKPLFYFEAGQTVPNRLLTDGEDLEQEKERVRQLIKKLQESEIEITAKHLYDLDKG
jgi:hypothetical protein